MRRQDDVIARHQAVELDLSPSDIRRKLRRRDWTAATPGVYVGHTGPLTSSQRAWVAVLHAWPAALSHGSAIHAAGSGTQPDGPIHVAIDADRKVIEDQGIVVHRITGLDDRVLWTTSPPRMLIEEAVLDVAATATTPERAVACLSDAVQSRSTTAGRLLIALDSRSRIRSRSFLREVLLDVRDGSYSVLEHHYLTKMERRHRLPKPIRQSRTPTAHRSDRNASVVKSAWVAVRLMVVAFGPSTSATHRTASCGGRPPATWRRTSRSSRTSSGASRYQLMSRSGRTPPTDRHRAANNCPPRRRLVFRDQPVRLPRPAHADHDGSRG
ncbi:hypothetical protein M2359_000635 [Gordonia amarae]|uniref:AbiEi antitoxin C-terminal domain-containing protein n=1 Tax=Gordonia amarae NBRC 15530 TaxID=1075090 RepID=G7GRS1_9ACTN|nr:hypothetical protein [Gordonia amarae]MCS3877006.1 hypothetical protein [Gordonia amarae]GAB06296.1 hypothetical protein GOAMR_50_00675 [Gordonia amarae NBRC 15530]